MIEKDKGRTTKSHIIGGVGYTLGSLVVVGVIVVQSFEFGFWVWMLVHFEEKGDALLYQGILAWVH